MPLRLMSDAMSPGTTQPSHRGSGDICPIEARAARARSIAVPVRRLPQRPKPRSQRRSSAHTAIAMSMPAAILSGSRIASATAPGVISPPQEQPTRAS